MTRSKASSGNGKRVASPRPRGRDLVDLAVVVHHAVDVADLDELGNRHVARDDVRAAPGGLEGMAAEAAAEVEHPIARREAEPVVVDSEHVSETGALGPPRREGGGTDRRCVGRCGASSNG